MRLNESQKTDMKSNIEALHGDSFANGVHAKQASLSNTRNPKHKRLKRKKALQRVLCQRKKERDHDKATEKYSV